MGRFEWLETPSSKKENKNFNDSFKQQEFDDQYYMKLADESFIKGDFNESLRYYSRVLNIDYKTEKAWLGQLLCLLELGEYNEALTWANNAQEIFPDSPDIIAAKALAWGRLGDLEKAKGFSDSSLKKGISSSFIWWARGDIFASDNIQNAEFCFKKASEIDKNDWRLFLKIGQTFMSLAKIHKAKDYFLHALNLNEDNPIIWYWLGISYQNLGIYDKAKDCLEKALDLKPYDDEFKKALSDLLSIDPLTKFFKKIKTLFN